MLDRKLFIFKKSKKAMELPINIIVMMIIGIILFGIGMGLLSKISNSGDKQVEELNNKIRNNIASLECSGEDWICAPNMKLRKGETRTFEVFVANKGPSSANFNIEIYDGITLTPLDSIGEITSNNCGTIKVTYPKTIEQSVQSGKSASFPIMITANKVSKACSFTAVAQTTVQGIIYKTPIIVRVE